MRRTTPAMLAIVTAAAALTLAMPNVAHGWEHNIVEWSDESTPLPLWLRPGGTRHTEEARLAELVAASIDAWHEVACSTLELDYRGIEDLPIEIDDQQVLAWEDDEDSWIYGSASAGATIIDVSGPDGPRVDILFNDIFFNWIEDSSTFVLPGYRFGEDPPLDVDPQSVITHEVGHLIGLAHPIPGDTTSQPDPLATMVFSLLPNAQQRTLAGDDKIGLCAKYPVERDGCDTDGDCPRDEFCATFAEDAVGTVQLCEEPRAGFGAFCGRDAYNCAGMCVFVTVDYREGFCTDTCETDADCPESTEETPWTCSTQSTTGGGEIKVCFPVEDEGDAGSDADVGEADADAGAAVDAGDAPDATSDTDTAPDSDTAPEDVGTSSDSGLDDGAGDSDDKSGDGGGCGTLRATPPSASGLALLFCGCLVAAATRRRRTA